MRAKFLGRTVTSTLLLFFSNPAEAGSFLGADAFVPNMVTHAPGYSGLGQSLLISVCLDKSDPLAGDAEAALLKAIDTWNELEVTRQNLSTGSLSDIPADMFDGESTFLHELGHCLGLAHTNLGSSVCPETDPQCLESHFTQSTTGGFQYSFETNLSESLGPDFIAGSCDDQRDNDNNLMWFFNGWNDPFYLGADVIDKTNYTRSLALLPTSGCGDTSDAHSFPTSGSREVGALIGEPFTEAVMHQGISLQEAQRTLTADDVATIRFAMTGLDELTSHDDYQFALYLSDDPSDCAIHVEFAPEAEVGFAQCSLNIETLSGPHGVVTNARLGMNRDVAWYFGQQPTQEPPAVGTLSAINATTVSAELRLSVNPGGLPTQAWFTWDDDSTPSTETPRFNVGLGTSSQTYSYTIGNLDCETTYSFRAHAQNSAGSDQGSVLSFTTASCSGGGDQVRPRSFFSTEISRTRRTTG